MTLPSLPWVIVLALAVYRITRVITMDKISVPFRDRLFDWAWDEEHPQVDEDTGTVGPSPRAGWRTWVHLLLTCAQCLGVWIAVAVYCAWRWGGDVSFAVLAVFAVAGAQSFLTSMLPADEDEEP